MIQGDNETMDQCLPSPQHLLDFSKGLLQFLRWQDLARALHHPLETYDSLLVDDKVRAIA
jgi:hypothetical protein